MSPVFSCAPLEGKRLFSAFTHGWKVLKGQGFTLHLLSSVFSLSELTRGLSYLGVNGRG